MNHIHLLDSDTINKIAAGEVVERPSSVVKELVENAIDAKATAITVEIKDGGLSFIRITDNGSGIDAKDIENAFKRHATSKITTAMDLISISSLGFRGEALSSIASVSQVELITKINSELTGIRYCIDGGVKKSYEEIGCPDGTTIIVRNLFYNTPARRKFLKSATTEAGYIADLIGRLSLSRPDVSFKFIVNGQNKLHTAGTSNLKDIIYQVYGREITTQLVKLEDNSELMQISGYIKSNIITQAIEDAYKTFVMVHKYPFTVFHIEIDPAYIDVNVHPRKMELRFNQNEAVYQTVYNVVRGALQNNELIHTVILEKTEPKEEKKADIPEPFEANRIAQRTDIKEKEYTPYTGSKDNKAKSYSDMPVRENPVSYHYEQKNFFEQKSVLHNETFKKTHRLIGQVFDTYWMIEYDSRLLIIDQHAAHEKVMYEKFVSDFESSSINKQFLSPPTVILLSMSEENKYLQFKDYFADLGFEVENFGGREYAISAIPLQLYGMNTRDFFIEILDNISDESKRLEGSAITYYIATMACKAAVKGNDALSFSEADALIKRLLELKDPYTCPHGRPTIISISKYEMEKKFKRIQ